MSVATEVRHSIVRVPTNSTQNFIVNFFKNYFNFFKTSARKEFWLQFVFLFTVPWLFFHFMVMPILGDPESSANIGTIFVFLIIIVPAFIVTSVFTFPIFASFARRIHDTGIGRHWIWSISTPFVLFITLPFLPADNMAFLKYLPFVGMLFPLALATLPTKLTDGSSSPVTNETQVVDQFKEKSTMFSKVKVRKNIVRVPTNVNENVLNNYFRNIANFSGTTTRKEFWLQILYFNVSVSLFSIIFVNLSSLIAWQYLLLIMIIFVPAGSILQYPILASFVRRLHDAGQSGLYALFIPVFIVVVSVTPKAVLEQNVLLNLLPYFILAGMAFLAALPSKRSVVVDGEEHDKEEQGFVEENVEYLTSFTEENEGNQFEETVQNLTNSQPSPAFIPLPLPEFKPSSLPAERELN
jgi:uncharacterized membrane protein YhaH (DUF805 family)